MKAKDFIDISWQNCFNPQGLKALLIDLRSDILSRGASASNDSIDAHVLCNRMAMLNYLIEEAEFVHI